MGEVFRSEIDVGAEIWKLGKELTNALTLKWERRSDAAKAWKRSQNKQKKSVS